MMDLGLIGPFGSFRVRVSYGLVTACILLYQLRMYVWIGNKLLGLRVRPTQGFVPDLENWAISGLIWIFEFWTRFYFGLGL